MVATNKLWISKLGFESLHPSLDGDRQAVAGPFGPDNQRPEIDLMRRPATLVDWAFAPAWLTETQAAALAGYSARDIQVLIEAGAVDAEQDAGGAWLIDKVSLRECQDLLREVVRHEYD